MHQVAAKAVCFREAQSFGFKEYQKQIIRNAAILAEVYDWKPGSDSQPAALTTTSCWSTFRTKALTDATPADMLEEAGINRKQELDPERYAAANDHERRTVRNAGRHHTRNEGRGNETDRRVDHSGPLQSRNQDLRIKIRNEVEDLCEQFPIYLDLPELVIAFRSN